MPVLLTKEDLLNLSEQLTKKPWRIWKIFKQLLFPNKLNRKPCRIAAK
ncbi:Uncharacterized protein dnl_07710 [Desulfonema limicola]|uniref:Uncharacterized protein n=1 Tax=Desulfonema limicola TaxID=45656 RepID=A0A975B4C0_9BACT|nr:Uncharacterized protein dnl_07710 [Desulfonema limicola]